MKSVAIVALALGLMASAAEAGTLVSFTGDENDSLVTTTAASSRAAVGNSTTSTLTNGAPLDANTVYGFHMGPGNFAGAGTRDAIASPTGVNFDSLDDDLGDVPHSSSNQVGFGSTQLDFGSAIGANASVDSGSFNDGLDNMRTLSPTQSLSSVIEGSFAGLTEQQFASALVVQPAVGSLELRDVASPGDVGSVTPLTHAPEPASMILFGSGLLYLARRKYYASNI